MGGIIGGDADLDPVALHDLDPVFLHTAGKDTSDNHMVFTFDLHCPTPKNPGDHAFKLNQILFAQDAPFPASGLSDLLGPFYGKHVSSVNAIPS